MEIDRITELQGYILQSAKDGAVIAKEGTISQSLPDVAFFFSSAADVIKNLLDIGEWDTTVVTSKDRRVFILPDEGGVLSCETGAETDEESILGKLKQLFKKR